MNTVESRNETPIELGTEEILGFTRRWGRREKKEEGEIGVNKKPKRSFPTNDDERRKRDQISRKKNKEKQKQCGF